MRDQRARGRVAEHTERLEDGQQLLSWRYLLQGIQRLSTGFHAGHELHEVACELFAAGLDAPGSLAHVLLALVAFAGSVEQLAHEANEPNGFAVLHGNHLNDLLRDVLQVTRVGLVSLSRQGSSGRRSLAAPDLGRAV
eukprot:scaffold1696_cov258-Pinguiococcus_pyrenoidosus.AAC.8